MSDSIKMLLAPIALVLGLGLGYWYGNSTGFDKGVEAQKNVAVNEAAKGANPFEETNTNPFSESTVNPFEGVKTNPFE